MMKDLPILASADVIVIGGGTAGIFAAVAAAESGVSVLLLEQQGFLGGTAVGALVTPMMSSRLPEGVLCSYLSSRLGGSLQFDPVELSYELEQLCLKAGVKLCYHVTLCDANCRDGQVISVLVATKQGMMQASGKVFIDCSGDGDLCVYAGAGYDQGDPNTGTNQPMSLRYLLGGVDMDRFGAFLEAWGQKTGLPHTARAGENNQRIYAAVTNQGQWALMPLFQQAVEAGDLTGEDMAYWQLFGMPGRRDTLAMNHPEFFDISDATNPFALTQVQLRGKEAIFRQLQFCRKYFPGCEHAYVAQIAPMVGIRESRRIHTHYKLTGKDLLMGRKFKDRIAQSNYPVDIHGLHITQAELGKDPEKPWYEIPFGALVVKGLDNLLVAGRCIGADFVAQSAIRIQLTCRSMGEAAGIAAALAARSGVSPAAIDGRQVAREMESRGAQFAG